MIPINKKEEPSSLLHYRIQPGAVYDGPNFTETKKAIREQLLSEQGHLCAYCMQRIDIKSMKIEHWHCQTNYPAEQLRYGNMLGVCPGNEGQPKRNQTCDTCKGDKDLLYNPALPADRPRLQIRYDGAGKIYSGDKMFDGQLDQVLNLNWWQLKENRKQVWNAVIEVLGKENGPRTRADLTALMDKWKKITGGRKREYLGVALYFLNKKLSKVS